MLSRRRRLRPDPLLSVVVPVFNVESYLDACLDSIAGQGVDDHEVIVVDDGSPDASVGIVQRRMKRDERVRLVRQENRGLGAARNAGVELVTGRHLTFVDSDDVLPPAAWDAMVASLGHTGSEIAIGRAERDDGSRRWATPLMERNHAVARYATDVREMPLLLADVFAWNKVFRKSFWDRAGIAFPEGTRYEDQPAMTAALLRARSVDVLTETVYRWALRGDSSSITQQRHTIEDLLDRIATKQESARLVEEYAGSAADRAVVREVFYRDVLPVDMWEYFRAVPGCSEQYWAALVAGTRDLWHEGTVAFERTGVPAQQRLMGWFVVQDRRADLEACLTWIDAHRPLPFEHGRLVHPWCTEPDFPPLPAG